VPLVASLLTAASERAGTERAESLIRRILPALAGALIVFTASCLSYTLSNPLVTPGETRRRDYPVRAVEWMKRHRLSGKIFNEYVWGGYIEWVMPESRVFIDPRSSVLLYPKGFVNAWKAAGETKPGWRKTLEEGRPDFVLLLPDDYLSVQLSAEPGWELIYRDGISVLYRRRGDAAAPSDRGAPAVWFNGAGEGGL
jgi:hypothetical protein